MIRRIVLASASVIALSAAANADGFDQGGARGYYPALWDGFYVGVHGGGAWGETEATDRLGSNGLPWVKNGAQFNARVDGALGGGTIGYNWQRSHFVFGLEGNVGYLGLKGSGDYNLLPTTKVESDGLCACSPWLCVRIDNGIWRRRILWC